METQNLQPDQTPSPAQPPSSTTPRRIASSELFVDANEVHIDHAGETYRLRKTRAGKLILTK